MQTGLEMQKEFDGEVLYNYHFNIKDLQLERFGLSESQLFSLQDLLLTTFARYLKTDLNEGYKIEKQNPPTEISEISDNTIYLNHDGIDLFSTSVDQINKNKDYLDSLTKDIPHLMMALLAIDADKSTNNQEQKEMKKVHTIVNFLEKEKQEDSKINKCKM